jgi:hypothetical protein
LSEEKAMKPTVGRIVHYVSFGSPVREDGSQAYESECRAAIVTEVPEGVENPQTVGLCVLNPTGMFFNRTVPHHDGGETLAGGTWHWPERA